MQESAIYYRISRICEAHFFIQKWRSEPLNCDRKALRTRIVLLNLLQSTEKRSRKEYFPNLLEITLCHQIFVFWDLKFWLIDYFLILLSCAKFQQDWTTLILDIWIFGRLQNLKTSNPLIKYNTSMMSNLSETLHS